MLVGSSFFLTTRCFVVVIVFFLTNIHSFPSSYEIIDVPFHRQITRYSCGDASFEMVYDYHQKDIDQRAIIDVCRTSEHVGTRVFDMVRAAHFSSKSAAASSRYYPEQAPQNGWSSSLQIGLAGFGYAGESCWLNELKEVISQGYPIMVLNHFSESDLGGHFRVAIGYDNETITFLDPWDRFWPRKLKISNEEFCDEIWNYPPPSQFNNETSPPFWAAFMAPWKVEVSYLSLNYSESDYFENKQFNFIQVFANVSYPCPAPFCGKEAKTREYPAENTNISIQLPTNMILVNASQTISPGTLHAGDSILVSWTVKIDDSLDVKFSTTDPLDSTNIQVTASGLIHGSVPKAFCCYNGEGGTYYPPYSYSDILGAVGTVRY